MTKINYEGFVEAIVTDKETGRVLSKCKTKNTLVEGGENFIAGLLSKSFVLSQPFPTDALSFVDYMSVGAGYTLAVNSADDHHITLPYYPIDGMEPVDQYDGVVVWAISGPNQGQSVPVAANGYNHTTRVLTLNGHFTNVPLLGEVYVVGTAVKDIQMNGEGEADENGNTILNTKKPLVSAAVHGLPMTNETELRAEWVESEGAFVVAEAALWYDLNTPSAGHSSAHMTAGIMFAKANFGINPPHKGVNDILQIRRTLRVGVDRTP